MGRCRTPRAASPPRRCGAGCRACPSRSPRRGATARDRCPARAPAPDRSSPSASSAMVRPPEAEPVSAASTLVATASETSGPPPMPSTQSRTTRERRQRRNDRAEADQARDAERRQDRGVGAGVHGFAQRRQAPAIDGDDREDRGGERGHHRPYAADRGQRCRAPALLRKIGRHPGAAARRATSGD